MKISGRNLKRRLYGLSLIGNRLRRIKHYRGHGVHSPFVYSLVRNVLMNKSHIDGDNSLYNSLYNNLIQIGVTHKRAIQLQRIMYHCGYTSFSIDNYSEGAQFCILSESYPTDQLLIPFTQAVESGTTLVVLSPYYNKARTKQVEELIASHRSTSVDNRAYIIFFNNYLPKQHYKL